MNKRIKIQNSRNKIYLLCREIVVVFLCCRNKKMPLVFRDRNQHPHSLTNSRLKVQISETTNVWNISIAPAEMARETIHNILKSIKSYLFYRYIAGPNTRTKQILHTACHWISVFLCQTSRSKTCPYCSSWGSIACLISLFEATLRPSSFSIFLRYQ